MNLFATPLARLMSVASVFFVLAGAAQAQWRRPALDRDWYDRYYGYVDDYSGYWDYDDYTGFDYNYWDDFSGYADYDDFGWNTAIFEEWPYALDEFGYEDYEYPYRTQEYYEALYEWPLYGYGPYEPAWRTERRFGPRLPPRARYGRRFERTYEVERWH